MTGDETPPWHPWCGCSGCRLGDWHGRRIVLRLSNSSKPKDPGEAQ